MVPEAEFENHSLCHMFTQHKHQDLTEPVVVNISWDVNPELQNQGSPGLVSVCRVSCSVAGLDEQYCIRTSYKAYTLEKVQGLFC